MKLAIGNCLLVGLLSTIFQSYLLISQPITQILVYQYIHAFIIKQKLPKLKQWARENNPYKVEPIMSSQPHSGNHEKSEYQSDHCILVTDW